MPPRVVVPTLLFATLAGLTLPIVVGVLVAVGLILALTIAVGVVVQWKVALLGGAVALLAVGRIALISAPAVLSNTTLPFTGVVVGVRTEPYARVRLTEPPAFFGMNLDVAPPVDQPLAPADRVTGSCHPIPLLSSPLRARLEHVVGRCRFTVLDRIEPGRGSGKALAGLRATVARHIHQRYGEPEGAFLEGLLVGAPPTGSTQLTATLRRAGLSHLVAVSGYNLTLVVGALSPLVLPLAGRRWGSGLVALGLLVFAGTAGFEASVMRAAAMAVLQLAAYLVGRPAALARLLAQTVLLTAWADPALALTDLGFQLSVAATFGIAVLANPLADRLRFVPGVALRTSIATSIAASTGSVPVLALALGRVNPWGAFSTVLASPAVAPSMLLGGVSLLLPVGLSALLAAPTTLMLDAVLWVARAAGALPGATLGVSGPVVLGVLLGAGLGVLLLRRARSIRLPGWGISA